MALKKDKQKVLDEVWTEQRVKDFLSVQPAENIDADFHVLLKAYQSMRLENFEEFVGFFVAEGRDLLSGRAGDGEPPGLPVPSRFQDDPVDPPRHRPSAPIPSIPSHDVTAGATR